MEEKQQQRHREGLTETSSSRVGVPGLWSGRRASPERLQQIVQFQKHQMEEKQVKGGLMLFDADSFQGNVLSQYVGLCTSVEEGSGDKAGRGTTRPRPSGFGSYSSANGEAAGQTEQAAEARFRPHQCQTGPGTATPVSNSFTPKQFCEVSLHDSQFASFQGDQKSKEDASKTAFLPSSTPAADDGRQG